MTKRLLILILCASLTVGAGPASAAVFKYKKDGAWHFTDDPAAVPPDQRTTPGGDASPVNAAATDLKARLTDALKPANAIETAALATVVVETTFGTGSGFFITADGYIITNKHVIRPITGAVPGADRDALAKADALDRFAAQIETRHQRLQSMQAELEEFRRFVDRQPESAARRLNEARYGNALQRYRALERNLSEARQRLAAQRSRFAASIVQQRVDAGVAALSSHFTIYLADSTPLYAYVVEISEDLDLALLKVDGYVTPHLPTESPYRTSQGDPVYAIGNPVNLRNSVTAGVVSGFEGIYVKTNAQIYPGNSGGPLITEAGKVIGVNTFKKITHKFEGLGFAIAIDRALAAFDAI